VGNVIVGPDRLRRLIGQAFIAVVRVGVDEDDRQRRRAARQQGAALRLDGGDIDRHPDGAVREGAFGNLKAHVALGDGDEITPQTPGVGPVAAAHFERVAESRRGDDADLRALAFQQRVGADSGAVNDRTETSNRSEPVQALDESCRFVAAIGRHFRGRELPRGLVEKRKIGEGTADIDANQCLELAGHAGLAARRRAVAPSSRLPSALTTAR